MAKAAVKTKGKPAAKSVSKPATVTSVGEGHNSGVSTKVLKDVVDRIERLEEEKAGISDDIKDIYAEAKAKGLDVKAVRFIIVQRRKDREQLRMFKEIVELYAFALDPELAEVLS